VTGHDASKRDLLKKAAYAAPVIITLSAMPSFAAAGSHRGGGPNGKPPGHGGTPPGLGGKKPPGHGGTPPGLGGSKPPGHGGTPPGRRP
jgi:hypothetical protein